MTNLDLTTGLNVITAHVSKDGKEATYVVNITKVETDFRGNVLVPAMASANGGTEADNAALTDLDPTTTWTSDPLVRASDWSSKRHRYRAAPGRSPLRAPRQRMGHPDPARWRARMARR